MKGKFIITIGVAAMTVAFLSGCAGIDPKTIPWDRFDYSAAISEPCQKQMLLSIPN